MAKLFFFDVETTGLSTYKCAMHQIAGAIVINGVIKETFDIKLAPFEGAVIEDKALEVSHVTESQIKAYPPPINAYRQILKMLGKYVDKYDKKDKFFLVGYNNKGFDNDFMRNFFKQQGDNYFGSWFWAGAIDVMVLAADYLQEEIPNMVDFKLRTVAEYLGIKLDPAKLHDALYDIEITKMVYDIVHHDSKKNVQSQTPNDAEPKAIEILLESENQPSNEPEVVYRQPEGCIRSIPNNGTPLSKEEANEVLIPTIALSREEQAKAVLKIVKESLSPEPVEEVTEETLRERGLIL
jgi:DNA polymerase-3 subunit epsilon